MAVAELRHLVIVLGDQLDLDAAAFDGFDAAQDAVWMAEVAEESTHVWSSKQRIAHVPGRDAALRAGPARRRPAAALHPARTTPPTAAACRRSCTPPSNACAPPALVMTAPGDWRVLAGDQERGAGRTACRWTSARTATSSARVREFAAHAKGRKIAAHGVLLPRDAPAPRRADGRRPARRRSVELRCRQPRGLRPRRARAPCRRVQRSSPMRSRAR